jgi:hypothetical protein
MQLSKVVTFIQRPLLFDLNAKGRLPVIGLFWYGSVVDDDLEVIAKRYRNHEEGARTVLSGTRSPKDQGSLLNSDQYRGDYFSQCLRSRFAETDAVVVYDVGGCVRSWGRRGILLGSLFGFAVGAMFVTNPLIADPLTFGTVGTLIICATECAVVAGGFGVLAATINGHGILRGYASGLTRTRAAGRLPDGK